MEKNWFGYVGWSIYGLKGQAVGILHDGADNRRRVMSEL